MPVRILNLAGLNVVDFKENRLGISRSGNAQGDLALPHCGRSTSTVVHAKRTLVLWDIPSHGKAVVIHLDVPRLKCRPCKQTFTISCQSRYRA